MGLYPVFLDAGYGPEYFWELSFGEVSDLLESYARRKEHEQKKREAELKNNTLGGEKWYWGFPQAFGITSRNGESIYVKVSAVVNGRETPQSETLKVS